MDIIQYTICIISFMLAFSIESNKNSILLITVYIFIILINGMLCIKLFSILIDKINISMLFKNVV